MTSHIDFPSWLENLFLKFSIAYEGLWTYSLKSNAELLAKKLMWFGSIVGFKEIAIDKAIDLAIKSYPKPPSIAEFLQLCQTEAKKLSLEHPQITSTAQSLPSPLLAQYMAANPVSDNDDFKIIFDNYKGVERGTKIMQELRRKINIR